MGLSRPVQELLFLVVVVAAAAAAGAVVVVVMFNSVTTECIKEMARSRPDR